VGPTGIPAVTGTTPPSTAPVSATAAGSAQPVTATSLHSGACCAFCGTAAAGGGPRLRLCRGCRAAHFCSDACYKAGWKGGHKQQCQAMQAARQQAGSSQGS
jgi:hypothetical protein